MREINIIEPEVVHAGNSPGLISGSPQRWPNLRQLAQPYLTRHYGDGHCWELVRDLLHEGGFVAADANPWEAMAGFQEIWWQDDEADPLTLVQPWDLYLMRRVGPAVEHPALVVDALDLVHAHRKAGVTIEPLRRWRGYLLQLGRLRELC